MDINSTRGKKASECFSEVRTGFPHSLSCHFSSTGHFLWGSDVSPASWIC